MGSLRKQCPQRDFGCGLEGARQDFAIVAGEVKEHFIGVDAKASVRRYRIGVLLYCRDVRGRLLLIERKRAPNRGLWCAVGGKLEMPLGESPFECARREAKEEIGLELAESDLSLQCILSEEDYEGTGNWLMFVFLVETNLKDAPSVIDEGRFRFFDAKELGGIAMPMMDRHVLTEYVLKKDIRFVALHAPKGAENDPGRLILLEQMP